MILYKQENLLQLQNVEPLQAGISLNKRDVFLVPRVPVLSLCTVGSTVIMLHLVNLPCRISVLKKLVSLHRNIIPARDIAVI